MYLEKYWKKGTIGLWQRNDNAVARRKGGQNILRCDLPPMKKRRLKKLRTQMGCRCRIGCGLTCVPPVCQRRRIRSKWGRGFMGRPETRMGADSENLYSRLCKDRDSLKKAERRVQRLVYRFVSVAERLVDWETVGFEESWTPSKASVVSRRPAYGSENLRA